MMKNRYSFMMKVVGTCLKFIMRIVRIVKGDLVVDKKEAFRFYLGSCITIICVNIITCSYQHWARAFD